MSRRRSAVFCAFVAALALGGCGTEPERSNDPPAAAPDSTAAEPTPPANPFAEPARRALRIELGLDRYERVEGTAGAPAVAFTAFFAGDTLRFIEERIGSGTSSERTTVYYFEDGVLFYAVRDERRPSLEPGTARTDTFQTRAAFGPDGRPQATQQIVGNEVGPASAAEVEGLRKHARALRDSAFVLRRNAVTPEVGRRNA